MCDSHHSAVAMEKRGLHLGTTSQTMSMCIPLLRGGELHINCGQEMVLKHTFQTRTFFPLKLFCGHGNTEFYLLCNAYQKEFIWLKALHPSGKKSTTQYNTIQHNTVQYKYKTSILANRKTYLKPEFTESRIYIKQTSVFFALRYCLGFVKQVFALQICIQDKLPHYYAIQILSLLHSSSLLQKHHMTQAKPAKCHHKHQEHCRGRNRRTFSGLYE